MRSLQAAINPKLCAMISFWSSNIRGLASKIDELKTLLTTDSESAPSMILLCETFLSADIPDSTIAIAGYSLIRRDRIHFGGGLIIYYKDCLHISHTPYLESPVNETLWFRIHLENTRLNCCLGYRPPGPDFSILDNISNSITSMRCKPSDVITIFGDFNGNCSEWCNSAPTTPAGRKLFTFCASNGLYQLVRHPTRFAEHSPPTLLDNVFCNQLDLVKITEVASPIGSSDHGVVCGEIRGFEASDTFTIGPQRDGKRNLLKANWPRINAFLRVQNWDELNTMSTIDEMWSYFKEKVELSLAHGCPQRRPNNGETPCAPWFNLHVRNSIQARNRAWSLYIKHRSPSNYNNFVTARTNCKRVVRAAKAGYFTSQARSISNFHSARSWHKLASRLYKGYTHSSKMAPIKTDSGFVFSAAAKANVFNNHFTKSRSCPPSFPTRQPLTDSVLSDISFSCEEVHRTLNSLDTSKACGPDNISNLVLKNCSDVLYCPLTKLFNYSMETSTLPSDWKHSRVTPIYKNKGSKESPNSYRPISIISNTAKILEMLVNIRLIKFLTTNKLIHPNQFGFRPKHSSTDQLVFLFQKWLTDLEKHKSTIVGFLDLSSAFDSVPHAGILHKLPSHGIRGQLFGWISNYLYNRTQVVSVDGFDSDCMPIKSGVPQGSSLAPTLFIIFVNDIASYLPTNISDVASTEYISALFADDTLLSSSSFSPATAAACLALLFDCIDRWAKDWGMSFNALKTKLMLLTRGSARPPIPNIYFQGNRLTFINKHKHIGLTISDDLKFSLFVEDIAHSVARDIYLLKILASNVTDRLLLLRIFKSYIRPKLEYACPAWLGTTITNINILEALQRRAIRVILGMTYCSEISPQHYAQLSLDSLLERRIYATACYGYKLYNGMTPELTHQYKPRLKDFPYAMRAPVIELPCNFPAPSLAFKRSPVSLITSLFNFLDPNLLTLPSLQAFRSALNPLRPRLSLFWARFNDTPAITT